VGVHVIVDCDACHISQGREEFVGTPVECGGCHIDNFNEAVDPNHALADFSQDCQECHPTVSSSWNQAVYQHPQQFALRGAHSSVNCGGCHSEMFAGTPQLCFGCHEHDYNSVSVPSHITLGFPTDCEACHNEVAWSGATFDHVQASGYELIGIHSTLSCVDCHANNRFDLPRECIGCHQNDYDAVTDPNHVAAGFPEDCTQCHNQNGWSPATFDHNVTSFPLTGQHLSIDCSGCHVNGQFTGTPSDCWSCHQDNYNGVGDPDHAGNNFSQDCTLCHTTSGWTPSTFNHAQTQFPLTGAHTSLNCVECHADGYSGTPSDCWSCHQDDYIGADDPDHVANNFSHDCTECHTTEGWDTGAFNHSQTQFPITGAHTLLDCIDCHAGGYSGTPTECFACHEDNYNNTTDPDHQAAGFPTTCESCHTTNGWQPAVFDHSQTQFPLTGAHIPLNCIDCHAEGYSGTPTDCWSCHEDDYNNVADPDHIENNFSQDCTQCHTTNGWTPVSFDHSQTQFPLTGAHLVLSCVQCHAQGYSGTPTDCWSCHEDDYIGAIDPDHSANNFPQDCTICHSTNGWEPSTFNHSQTQFPLTGAHIVLNCLDCHSGGYSGTPTDCWSCHQDDYNNVADPDHVGGNYNQDCTECHTTNGWAPANFNHNQTQFPLTGAHLVLACIACHSSGYNNTPIACFACHEDDYNNTTDPNHVAAGFPTNCEQCHNTTDWEQTTWDHDNLYFPIYSGRHQGEWNLCVDCHVNPNDYEVFECIFCHAHNQPDMDEDHIGVPGYVYESTACYNCHPDGE
jgi:nitrate/TMAO reductase-like tetraheme cytochrome c subunit